MRTVTVAGLLVVLVTAGSCTHALPADVREPELPAREVQAQELLAAARRQVREHDLLRAEQYYSAALRLGANPEIVTPELVELCVRDKRYRSAVGYLEVHLASRPDDHRARLVLAAILLAVDDRASAFSHLELVVEAEPTLASAHYLYARLLREDRGKYEEADRHFRYYLALHPEGPYASQARSYLLTKVP